MSSTFALVSALLVGLMLSLWIYRYAPTRETRVTGYFGIFALFLYSGWLGSSGLLADMTKVPPPFLFYIASLWVIAFAIVASSWGRQMIEATPLRVLVGMQIFRVLPEILLDLAWREGLAPIQMTYHGRNWDILTAITALLLVAAWPRLKRPQLWAGLHTALGLVLLINIVTIAILSSPIPFRVFMNEPANTFVVRFPFIYLPGVHVLTALLLHGLVFRKLLKFQQAR